MDYTQNDIAVLTDDEYELDALTPDRASIIEPDDPMYVEIAQLCHQIAHYKDKLPYKQRSILSPALNNVTPAEIIKNYGVSAGTLHALRKNPNFRTISALQERIDRLNRGPDLSQRMAMLWRIAKREETAKPTTSLKAIDIMNKQDGIYMSADKTGDTISVTVQTFNFGLEGKPLEDLRDITPSAVVSTVDKNDAFKPLIFSAGKK
jgi:hypothetical protein